VTSHRPVLLERAIRCFLAQTYENKELVIVYPSADEATRQCLSAHASTALKPRPVEQPDLTLGAKRNISIESASGEYICIWDDDDWYSPARLTTMHGALTASKKAAAMLTRLLIYHAGREQAFLSHERLWENSLVFHRRTVSELGIRYPSKDRSEDYEFVNGLIAANLVYPVLDPTLYIYHCTGVNACSASHWEALLRRSTLLSTEQSAQVKRIVELSVDPSTGHSQLQTEWFRAPLRYVPHSAVPRP